MVYHDNLAVAAIVREIRFYADDPSAGRCQRSKHFAGGRKVGDKVAHDKDFDALARFGGKLADKCFADRVVVYR